MTRESHMRRALARTALALLALGSCAPALAQLPTDCSIPGQNTFVRNNLREFYLWYQELPDPDPALFDSPSAYLEAVRYRPLDASFSYVADRASNDAYYSESQFIGIGLTTKQTGPEELRVAQVFAASPAEEAGLARGDTFVAIGGRSVAELAAAGELGSAFGPNETGFSVDLAWRTLSGETRSATVAKREVTIPTVSLTRVFDLDGRPVGYLHFRNFVRPSIDALNVAFAELGAAGAQDLVLDLRYNGGGLVDVARHLGGLIGGLRTSGQVFVEFFHNDKNAFRNQVQRFEDPPGSLDLPRLVVLTTRASASASEAIVNSLRPFLPVTIVGEATYGKPVGQYGFNFCDKVLYPVAFFVRNALGQGDYFGGLPPDCGAADDLEHPLGNPEEASLAEAFHFLRAGACSARASAAAAAQSRLAAAIGRRPAGDGWQRLLNAY